MLKHVIVTGGTGLTGNALVRFLLNKRIRVTALVRPHSARYGSMPEDDLLRVVDCDLESYCNIDAKLLGSSYDAFFHLAWDGSMGPRKKENRNDMYLQLKNVKYMLDAVELCGRLSCPIFLATGSQAEYGLTDRIISEESRENPKNGYGNAKLCAGRMSRIRCGELGIKHIWARLFSIYGPNDGAESLIDTSIKKLIAGESPAYTAGMQTWDYLYSFDAAKALLLLAERGIDGEIYCVAGGSSKQLKEYIYELHEVVAPNITPRLGEIPYAEGQVMHMEVCTDKIKKLGFRPDYSFREGIQEIYASQMQML